MRGGRTSIRFLVGERGAPPRRLSAASFATCSFGYERSANAAERWRRCQIRPRGPVAVLPQVFVTPRVSRTIPKTRTAPLQIRVRDPAAVLTQVFVTTPRATRMLPMTGATLRRKLGTAPNARPPSTRTTRAPRHRAAATNNAHAGAVGSIAIVRTRRLRPGQSWKAFLTHVSLSRARSPKATLSRNGCTSRAPTPECSRSGNPVVTGVGSARGAVRAVPGVVRASAARTGSRTRAARPGFTAGAARDQA
jgi:hypothetical protein